MLQNVLLSGAVMSGSDGDVRIDVTMETAPPGINVLLPKERLQAIAKLVSDADISVTVNGSSCVVSASDGEWTLPMGRVDEYPTWDVVGARPVARLAADHFVRAVKGVVFSTDCDSGRYALGGVMVEVKGDCVTFVATDGRRLSCFNVNHDLAVDDSQTLIPACVFEKCLKLIPQNRKQRDNDGDDEDQAEVEYHCDNLAVQIESTSSEVVITIGQMAGGVVQPWRVCKARLLDGRFPNWRDVIPERSDAKPTKVNRQALLAATKAARIVTTESSKGVDYAFGTKRIRLHGKSSEAGESHFSCDVVEAGDTCGVKLDPLFVSQWLAGISGDAEPEVEVEAVDEQSAVVLRCGDHTGVIMPLAKD